MLGSGIAGLRAALGLARHGDVLVVTKDQPTESNTGYAQGGVAVALGEDDDVVLHLQDTLSAGAGIVSAPAARVLVEEGPERIRELASWGARFDREGGRFHLTREGAHSRNRVLHALGDATGWEMVRALLERTRYVPRLAVRSFACSTDLVAARGRVTGCRFLDEAGRTVTVLAAATLIATGGAGQVFSDTTNPAVATGDGIAMALRAGASLLDMEFVQFHPTALALEGAPRFLVSEAVRGEGAFLRNGRGERFTGELAARDEVARAIDGEIRQGRGPVTLDLAHLDPERVKTRFPRIVATCRRYGLDLTRDPVPVSPAAHYLMGGIATDLHGRATVPGLYAAGEVAATGVHGANRLASNSLLEGLVFGARAAEVMVADGHPRPEAEGEASAPRPGPARALLPRAHLQRRAWEDLGLWRERSGLRRLLDELEDGETGPPADREAAELRNLVEVAAAMAACALFREESRGGHHRSDFPSPDDARFLGHTLLDHSGPRLVPVDQPLEKTT
ncbi:MAG TPA: L-aspartate oxidase [Vicinamibacteria bacterium]|nr:L-aspartate oxidase [Vicinamibacteria bacterium]